MTRSRRTRKALPPVEQATERILRRLNAIVALLSELEPPEGRRRKAQEISVKLAELGFTSAEIAEITGRALSNVSRDISFARSGRIKVRR